MTPKSPVDQLLAAKENLSPKVRKAVLALGADAIPALVAILDDDVHCSVDAPGEGWAPVHAADLLVALGATEAIEPMLRLIRDSHPDTIIHDCIVDRLPKLGAAVLEPALRHLKEVEERDARGSLCAIVSSLGVKDDRVFEALSAFFDEEPHLGSALFADYGDPRALPRIRRLLASLEPDSARSPHELGELVEDYELLGGVFDEELRAHVEGLAPAQREQPPAAAPATPYVAAVKVGRNDPCPCGSGKKFKKCCITKAAVTSEPVSGTPT